MSYFFVFIGATSLGFVIGAAWRSMFEQHDREQLDITEALRRRR